MKQNFIEIKKLGEDRLINLNVDHIVMIEDRITTAIITLSNGERIETDLSYSKLCIQLGI